MGQYSNICQYNKQYNYSKFNSFQIEASILFLPFQSIIKNKYQSKLSLFLNLFEQKYLPQIVILQSNLFSQQVNDYQINIVVNQFKYKPSKLTQQITADKMDKLFNKKSNYLKLQKQHVQSVPKFRSKDQKKQSKQNSKNIKKKNQKLQEAQAINFLKQAYLLTKQENQKICKKLSKKQNKISQLRSQIQQLESKLQRYQFQMKTKANSIQQFQPTFGSTQKQSHHNRSFSSKNIQNSEFKSEYNLSSSRKNKQTIQSQTHSEIQKEKYEIIIKQLQGLSRSAIDKFKKLQVQNQQLICKGDRQAKDLKKQLQKTKSQLKKMQTQNYQLIRSELLEIKQKNNIQNQIRNKNRRTNDTQKDTIQTLNQKIKDYEKIIQLKDQKIHKFGELQSQYIFKQEKFKNMLHQITIKVNTLQQECRQYQQMSHKYKSQLRKVSQRCLNTQQKLKYAVQKYKQKKDKYKKNKEQWENIFTDFLKQMIILEEQNIKIRGKSEKANKQNCNISISNEGKNRNSRQKKVTFRQ